MLKTLRYQHILTLKKKKELKSTKNKKNIEKWDIFQYIYFAFDINEANSKKFKYCLKYLRSTKN